MKGAWSGWIFSASQQSQSMVRRTQPQKQTQQAQMPTTMNTTASTPIGVDIRAEKIDKIDGCATPLVEEEEEDAVVPSPLVQDDAPLALYLPCAMARRCGGEWLRGKGAKLAAARGEIGRPRAGPRAGHANAPPDRKSVV